MNAAKVIVTLKRISWRDGRPRFEPSPTLRAFGFHGEDLKHADGTWFSEGECLDWLRQVLEPKLASLKQDQPAPAPKKHLARPPRIWTRPVYTIAQMFLDLWQRPEFQGEATASGRRTRTALKPKTIKEYKKLELLMANKLPALWASDCAATSPRQWEAFLIQIEQQHGLATARACRATLSMAFARMKPSSLRGLNPVSGIKMPMPKPRLRVGSIAEMEHLIATADRMGRPEIGDSILLGLMTGQRQGDRLLLEHPRLIDGTITLKQAKTGAIVSIPATPSVMVRLEAARARRKASKIQFPHVIIDETINKPFRDDGSWYRDLFRQIVAEAARDMPSLTGFHDQDLRDTSVTWLGNAGCEIIEIAAITGHSLQSIHTVLRHYLARHPDQARTAITKMLAYLKSKGSNL